MRARFAVLVTLLACSNPSPLDRAFDHPAKPHSVTDVGGDPWAATGKKKDDNDKGDDDKGFDLKGALERIKDGIEKPGPYEAPDKSSDFDASRAHWDVLRLHGGVVEREAFSWTGGRGTELRQLIERLRDLAKDAQVSGLILRVEGLQLSLPDAIELRAAMHELRAAGKQLACHAESATNTMYLVLSACDRVGLAPLGEIAITGPAAMPIHVKPLLDKLGVQADFLHVGAYKGAAEPLTRDAPSREMEETLGAILDRRYETMVDLIASERKLEPAAVKVLIDTALFTADEAKAARLIDEVEPFEAFRDEIKAPWKKIELERKHRDQLQSWLSIARFLGAMPADRPIGEHVALVYAVGNIIDGKGGGLLGAREEIASDTLVAALRALAADDAIKAVVLRVDSGGGSAQASELIWHAVAALRAKKPVIVSMSDVAASGGYYISSGATKIFALDDTLTGSIGVVGGKLAPDGALSKLGIHTFPMGRGKRATMMASLAPWRDDEKAVIQASMEAVYKQFVARVAEGRHKTVEQILPIAQGRVWTGERAKQLGLVDEIGGLDAALAEARKLGNVSLDSDVEIYPPTPTLRDVLAGFGQVQTPFGISIARDELRALDPTIAAAAERLLELTSTFRSTPIQTIAILPEIR
jgi:protease-4